MNAVDPRPGRRRRAGDLRAAALRDPAVRRPRGDRRGAPAIAPTPTGRGRYVVHHWPGKPWLERTHDGVYSRLLRRLLSGDDVAVRVPDPLDPPPLPARARRLGRAQADRCPRAEARIERCSRGPRSYCVADARYFLGAVGLVNSLRLQGHDEPIHLLDCGLTPAQRALLEPEVTLVDAPRDAAPQVLKAIAPLAEPADTSVLIDVDMIATRSLGPLIERAAAGSVIAVADPQQRFFAEWGELFDLGPARPGPYVSSGLVACGGELGERVLRAAREGRRRGRLRAHVLEGERPRLPVPLRRPGRAERDPGDGGRARAGGDPRPPARGHPAVPRPADRRREQPLLRLRRRDQPLRRPPVRPQAVDRADLRRRLLTAPAASAHRRRARGPRAGRGDPPAPARGAGGRAGGEPGSTPPTTCAGASATSLPRPIAHRVEDLRRRREAAESMSPAGRLLLPLERALLPGRGRPRQLPPPAGTRRADLPARLRADPGAPRPPRPRGHDRPRPRVHPALPAEDDRAGGESSRDDGPDRRRHGRHPPAHAADRAGVRGARAGGEGQPRPLRPGVGRAARPRRDRARPLRLLRARDRRRRGRRRAGRPVARPAHAGRVRALVVRPRRARLPLGLPRPGRAQRDPALAGGARPAHPHRARPRPGPALPRARDHRRAGRSAAGLPTAPSPT